MHINPVGVNIISVPKKQLKNMHKLLLIFLMLSIIPFNKMNGQTSKLKAKQFDYTHHRLGIFISPPSFVEIQNATTGIGMSYRLSKKWELTAEPGLVYDAWYRPNKSKGGRIIFTVKHFFARGHLFYGLDARAKAYSYNDEQDFLNVAAGDSLFDYKHRVRITFIGIAPMFGIRAALSKNKRFVFQFNTGVGAKYRDVSRKNIPAGYTYHDNFYSAGEWISYDYKGSKTSGFTIYFPLGFHFIYLI